MTRQQITSDALKCYSASSPDNLCTWSCQLLWLAAVDRVSSAHFTPLDIKMTFKSEVFRCSNGQARCKVYFFPPKHRPRPHKLKMSPTFVSGASFKSALSSATRYIAYMKINNM